MSTELVERQAYQGIKFLNPADLEISESPLAGLTVSVAGELYEGVRASLAMPITDSERYVSLRVGATKGEEVEIGMIRELKDLDPACQRLIQRELKKRYFLHVIHKIVSLKEKFGFLYFEAETSKGFRKFAVRYEGNRVQEYSEFGRMILDTDDNRYIVPDLRLLSPEEHKTFTRYIYW